MIDVGAELRERGYAVLRGLVPAAACAAARAAFATEVRAFDGPLMRQASARAEPHRRGAGGLVVNGLLGIHELDPQRFAAFTAAATRLIGDPALVALLAGLLGGPPVVVETMYFESSRGNGLHADAHYHDAVPPAVLLGAWIALEDIAEDAGRFFVYPRSHLLGTDALAGADAYRAYAEQVIATSRAQAGADPVRTAVERASVRRWIRRIVDDAGLTPHAPPLAAGDVVLWTSRTLHGSHPPRRDDHSRHSITAHYLTAAARYVERGEPRPLRLRPIGALAYHVREA